MRLATMQYTRNGGSLLARALNRLQERAWLALKSIGYIATHIARS